MTSVQEDLNTVAVKILEDWAMMLVEPAESWEGQFNQEEKFYVGSLHFHGIVSGTYAVICQEGFARLLASNLIGTDEESTESQICDALSEMANVLSGNMLTSAYGDDVVFALTSPVTESKSFKEIKELFGKFTLTYRADDEPVTFAFIPEKAGHGD